MAKKAVAPPRTDHSEQIETLRENAGVHADHGLVMSSIVYAAAADLLEVHDDTGISLDNFGSVTNLVNFALQDLGLGEITPNGV